MRLKPIVVTTAILLCLSALQRSQDGVDLGVVDRIKSEAIGRSRVMDHLRYLTDVHGPRLTGSTQFEDAAKWTTAPPSEQLLPDVADVGPGPIDWARIFAHAPTAGIKHYFVEHDQPASPFDSLAASAKYLAALRF